MSITTMHYMSVSKCTCTIYIISLSALSEHDMTALARLDTLQSYECPPSFSLSVGLALGMGGTDAEDSAICRWLKWV